MTINRKLLSRLTLSLTEKKRRCHGETTSETFHRPPPAKRRFPALSNSHFRLYWIGTALANAADNIEHVIGYWVIWEVTHSPFWLGYAVVAHWLPFTLFSLHSGSLADRFNSRYLIQISQGLYLISSFGAPHALLLGGALTGLVVLGTGVTIRSLWDAELKEERLAGPEASVAVTGS